MINPFTACVKHRTALIFETGFLGGQHLRAMRAAKGRKERKLFDSVIWPSKVFHPSKYECWFNGNYISSSTKVTFVGLSFHPSLFIHPWYNPWDFFTPVDMLRKKPPWGTIDFWVPPFPWRGFDWFCSWGHWDRSNVSTAIINHQYFDGSYHPLMVKVRYRLLLLYCNINGVWWCLMDFNGVESH